MMHPWCRCKQIKRSLHLLLLSKTTASLISHAVLRASFEREGSDGGGSDGGHDEQIVSARGGGGGTGSSGGGVKRKLSKGEDFERY